jgi:MFS family permease
VTHPYLRYIAASTATFNFFSSVIAAIVIYYAVKELGLSAALIGLVFTVSQVGPLIGALLATRVWRRFGVGPTIVGSSLLAGPVAISIPLAPHDHAAAVAIIGAAYAIGGLSNVVYNVTQVSLRQAMAPERIQGRMNAVMRFLVWGTIPLGQLVGGALATTIGLRATLWVGALGSCIPFLPVLLSPVRSVREMPEAAEEEHGLPTEPLVADAAAATTAVHSGS